MKKTFRKIFGIIKPAINDKPCDSDKTLSIKINSAIKECNVESEHLHHKISDIKDKAKVLISKIFYVPNAYWYDELNFYEKIKSCENNQNLNFEIVSKTDKLIEEYKDQIKLCKTRIDLCEGLKFEFEEIIKILDEKKAESERLKIEENKLSIIKEHSEFIDKLNTKEEDLQMDKVKADFEEIKDEILRINEAFRIKQKVKEYMCQLDDHINNGQFTLDIQSIRKELETIAYELKKR